MFPFGELGWHQHIPKKNPTERGNSKIVRCSADRLISPLSITNVDDLLNNEEIGKEIPFMFF